MQANRDIVAAFEEEFASVRAIAESAISQLDSRQIRASPDDQTNSVVIIMKHVAGSLISRFTYFLTQDGEKPWRRRDNEFAKAKQPMACKAITDRAIADGLWTTGGKTPQATLYAAIIREIDKKGKDSRFRKVDRGLFALKG